MGQSKFRHVEAKLISLYVKIPNHVITASGMIEVQAVVTVNEATKIDGTSRPDRRGRCSCGGSFLSTCSISRWGRLCIQGGKGKAGRDQKRPVDTLGSIHGTLPE